MDDRGRYDQENADSNTSTVCEHFLGRHRRHPWKSTENPNEDTANQKDNPADGQRADGLGASARPAGLNPPATHDKVDRNQEEDKWHSPADRIDEVTLPRGVAQREDEPRSKSKRTRAPNSEG